MQVSNRTDRGPGRVLVAALAAAAAAGTGVGGGLALWVAALNELGAADTVRLAGYLIGLYGVVFALGSVGSGAAALLFGFRPGFRFFLALIVAGSVFLSGVLRFNPAIQLLSVVPSMSLIGVLDVLVVAAGAAACAALVLAKSGVGRLAAAASAVALLGGLQAFHLWHEEPRRLDLRARVAPLVEGAVEAPLPATADRFEDAKLVVLGFDGLTWEILIAFLERGEVPNFARLLADSAYGYLETLSYPVSPVVWETIWTGQEPAQHGIGHHFHLEFPGLSERVRVLPSFRLANSPMGLRRMLAATKHFAPWRTIPAPSSDARAARLWEIASRSGIDVGVYHFMNTTPATPVNGFIRGMGAHPPINYPPDLEDGLPELAKMVLPEAAGKAPTITEVPDRERGLWQRFLALEDRFHPQALLYYTHFGDGINHVNWKFETVGPGLFFSGLHHPDFVPGVASSTATHFLDEILGDVLARIPDDAVLAVVSDHGFEFRGYEHDNSPPGVFILRGPGIEPGVFEGATVYDVAPTLLHGLGLAVADDMSGAPLERALGERPVRRIASYGPAARALGAGDLDPVKLKEHEDYLRSLGYVVD